MLKNKLALIIGLLSLSVILNGQSNKKSYITLKSRGIFVGAGFINEILSDDYSYKVTQFIYNYSIPILNQNNIKKHNLVIQFEPQVNPVFLKGEGMELEAGFNVGLIYNYRLFENVLLDVGIGSGFHYITKETNLQAKGFIFSDNFILGISKRIEGETSDWELNIQIRFRHLSNLDIKMPNKGLDNFIIYFGISKLL